MTKQQMTREQFEEMVKNDPDLQKIYALTENPHPVTITMSAYDLFVLVGVLQTTTRIPGVFAGPTLQHIIHMATTFITGFATVAPDVIPILNTGWNPALDVEKDGTPGKKRIHQVWAIYMDGLAEGEQALAEYHRPQDWGDPRWMHRVYTLETEELINIVHCWVDVKMEEHEHLKLFTPLITMIMTPGSNPQLCGKDFIAEDDFWDKSWGIIPPPADDDDFMDDLFVFDTPDYQIDPADDDAMTPEEFGKFLKNAVDEATGWANQIKGAVIDATDDNPYIGEYPDVDESEDDDDE